MQQELVQQIEETAKDVMDGIHTALPAKIISFDPSKCVATIKPYGKYATSDGISLEYPTVTEVPVVFPVSPSTGVGMVFPVKAGDDCLIIVSEVELDEWRSGAESEGTLRFDLTSAIAIPGLLKTANSLAMKACNLNAVILSAGSTEIAVSGSGVAIKGNLTVDGNITYTGSISGG